jgi:hypothetical protein
MVGCEEIAFGGKELKMHLNRVGGEKRGCGVRSELR